MILLEKNNFQKRTENLICLFNIKYLWLNDEVTNNHP